MLTQVIRQASIQGIAASALASGKVPPVGKLHAIYLQCLSAAGVQLTPAQMANDIELARVVVDGKVVCEASAAFLLNRQEYYGNAYGSSNVNGVLPIFFDRKNMPTWIERQLFALGTKNIASIAVELQCAAGLATLGTCNVFTEVSNQIETMGQHIRLNRYAQTFAGTGVQEISTLPIEGDDIGYLAIHIEHAAGTLVDAQLKMGGTDIYDRVPVEVGQVMQEMEGLDPQATIDSIALHKNGDLTAFVPMTGVKDWRLLLNWSVAPNNYNIYTERIFGLNVKK